jgi:hypothetical protein
VASDISERVRADVGRRQVDERITEVIARLFGCIAGATMSSMNQARQLATDEISNYENQGYKCGMDIQAPPVNPDGNCLEKLAWLVEYHSATWDAGNEIQTKTSHCQKHGIQAARDLP